MNPSAFQIRKFNSLAMFCGCTARFVSILFENPEDKYSRDTTLSEPRSEKTGLRGFRPGPTQTGLYSHRSWLEA